ncbi:ATP-dependent nuclease [Tardiphaga sp. 804_B3_N1_9]|uniref:ATP-dependent nuclease n=1 Tax=Tardiphaga sp. 804_B3_N1_9 TaxID=3240786 RepID=UPI003F26A181
MSEVPRTGFLPKLLNLGSREEFYNGKEPVLEIRAGLTTLVGPNAAGKTAILRSMKNYLSGSSHSFGKELVYLTAGRGSSLESFRFSGSPDSQAQNPAAIGHTSWMSNWATFEGSTGMYMRLKARPDLLLKVQARLQGLHERRLRLEWTQSGLQVSFSPVAGGNPYFANVEASGLLQIIPLLAAMHDDGIFALLIDEPEISLHPQLQSFILQEMLQCAGDPGLDSRKKLIVLATHSPSMLSVRKTEDIRNLIFFADRKSLPSQVPTDAGELKNRKLSALLSRLSENHKLAFFARNVLLVEGPADETIVSALAIALKHPLLGANTQIVPVTGKGQFPETVKLFRLMAKNVFVLGDLDLLVDDSQIVSTFQEVASILVEKLGGSSLLQLDAGIRSDFSKLVDAHWDDLAELAVDHNYYALAGDPGLDSTLKAKRRSALAVLLNLQDDQLKALAHEADWRSIRARYEVLLNVLDSSGCIVLRRGTIEDYYLDQEDDLRNKPASAAREAEVIIGSTSSELRARYGDVVRAIETAAPIKEVDENDLLREQLSSLLGVALMVATPGMSDAELNTRAAANFSTDKPIFSFKNQTRDNGRGGYIRSVEVRIQTELFARVGFPFHVTDQDNILATIERVLP